MSSRTACGLMFCLIRYLLSPRASKSPSNVFAVDRYSRHCPFTVSVLTTARPAPARIVVCA